MILKIESYCNEKGMLIQQKTIISGPPAPYHQFIGTIGVKIESANDPDAMQKIEFAIEAETIEEAFEKFVKSADEKIENIRKEQSEALEKEFKKPLVLPMPAKKSKK